MCSDLVLGLVTSFTLLLVVLGEAPLAEMLYLSADLNIEDDFEACVLGAVFFD